MNRQPNRSLLIGLLLCSVAFWAVAESERDAGNFGLGLRLGTQTFLEAGTGQHYQGIGLSPEFTIGKFGVGLDLTVHFLPSFGGDADFKFREADWIPEDGTSWLELYLPKISYLRYGYRGEPLYVKFGSHTDITLGTGFIVGNYSNSQFLPEKRIFGFAFDLDGQLFNFPYLGLEGFVGNLASFDVMGGRLYVRPMAFLDVPVVKDLQIGASFATDLDPDKHRELFEAHPFFEESDPDNPDAVANSPESDPDGVMVLGADVIVPILSTPAVSLVAYGDFVMQPGLITGGLAGSPMGGMLGVSGDLFRLVPFSVQARFAQENFIPTYFDSTYDFHRAERYLVATGKLTTPASFGWLASLGFSLLADSIALTVSAEGPFKAPPNGDRAEHAASEYPQIKAVFSVSEALLAGFSINAYYEKRFISSFADFASFEEALIGASLSYNLEPATFTFAYDVTYDPAESKFKATSSMMVTIDFLEGVSDE